MNPNRSARPPLEELANCDSIQVTIHRYVSRLENLTLGPTEMIQGKLVKHLLKISYP